jgi:hypothetical protein
MIAVESDVKGEKKLDVTRLSGKTAWVDPQGRLALRATSGLLKH